MYPGGVCHRPFLALLLCFYARKSSSASTASNSSFALALEPRGSPSLNFCTFQVRQQCPCCRCCCKRKCNGYPSVAAGIYLALVKDRLYLSVHDLRCLFTVGIQEHSVLVRLVFRSVDVTVSERCLQVAGSCRPTCLFLHPLLPR